jgi:hypothetical protein
MDEQAQVPRKYSHAQFIASGRPLHDRSNGSPGYARSAPNNHFQVTLR